MEATPKQPLYCQICTLPVEYCTYSPTPLKCKSWLKEERPETFDAIYPSEARDRGTEEATERLAKTTLGDKAEEDDPDKKHQTRGGKGMLKDESKRLEKEEQKRKKSRVVIRIVERNKRKSVTHIKGMEAFGLDLKKVAKRLASKYACGCSVAKNPAGYDEIVIQGDFVDDLLDFIPEEYPEVPEEQIEVSQK